MQSNWSSKRDWLLFRSKLAGWQEAYIGRLNKEYIELLRGDGSEADKFWKLCKRIRENRRCAGVQISMRGSDTLVIGSEVVVTEPKTKAAVRTLLLPPKVLEVFREYRKRNASRWLFPSPKKEDSPLLPSVVRQRLHRLLDHAGCERVRFHDLRHTFATNALARGMDIKTLSTILGHVSTATTLNTYSHITEEMRRQAAARIGGHRQSAAAAGRRKHTTRAHDDRLPGKKAMEQTDGITGSSPPRLREVPGGAAFRCLWANMWSKGCGAKRNA